MEEKEQLLKALAACYDALHDAGVPTIAISRRSTNDFCILAGGSNMDYLAMFAALFECNEGLMNMAAIAMSKVAKSKYNKSK